MSVLLSGWLGVFHMRITDHQLLSLSFWNLPTSGSPRKKMDRPYTREHMPLHLIFHLKTKPITPKLSQWIWQGTPVHLCCWHHKAWHRTKGLRHTGSCSLPSPGRTSWPQASLKGLGLENGEWICPDNHSCIVTEIQSFVYITQQWWKHRVLKRKYSWKNKRTT